MGHHCQTDPVPKQALQLRFQCLVRMTRTGAATYERDDLEEVVFVPLIGNRAGETGSLQPDLSRSGDKESAMWRYKLVRMDLPGWEPSQIRVCGRGVFPR
jgi:hypothetical protein